MIECCVFIWISAHAGECAAEGALFRPRRVPGQLRGAPAGGSCGCAGQGEGQAGSGCAPGEVAQGSAEPGEQPGREMIIVLHKSVLLSQSK